MTAFAGIVSFDGTPIARRNEERLAGTIARRLPSWHAPVERTPRAVFICDGSAATPRGLFSCSSRLDNRDEIAAATNAGRDAGEADCIRRIFELQGDAGIARLFGVFAFADWDERSATLTLARDYAGFRSLFYHADRGFVAFASHLGDLLALPEVPRELDERMLANFLALNHRETEATFYRGILRVPSRSVVRISPRGIERHQYWTPNVDAPPPYSRDEDYIARARELFDRATVRKLRDTPRAAMYVSGGLDSSAMAATAARLGMSQLDCYTGLPPPDLGRPPRNGWYLDERPKVEALARMHPSLRMTFVTPRGAHKRQSDPARYFPEVPLAIRNTCNLGWFAQVEDAVAADGHRVVMTGSAGNMTTSWDGSFSLTTLASQGRLFELLREARAISRADGRRLLRVLAGQGVVPLLPVVVQRMVARLRGIASEDVSAFSLVNPAIIEELDLRRQWREDGFDPTYSARGTSARLRAHQLFDQLQISRDFVGMRHAAGGPDVRDPFGDRDLAEFCLSVPDTLYRRNGVRRWFARQVFADRLPREVLEETKSGEQAPNWFESLDARKPIIEGEVERIEASRLASRLIDLPRLKRLIAEWPKDALEAHGRTKEYRYALDRAVHVGQFIRWVEGGNA